MNSKAAGTGRRAGLSQAIIAAVAKRLTKEVGLEGWKISDLAEELGVAPSVIYHHYKNRDAVVQGVVESVLL